MSARVLFVHPSMAGFIVPTGPARGEEPPAVSDGRWKKNAAMISFIVLLVSAVPVQVGAPAGPTIVVTAPKSRPHVDSSLQVDDENDSEQYGPIWPEKAYDHRVGGKVILSCRITAQGFARACSVLSETPGDMGFGAAALQIQPSLKLSPPAGAAGSGAVPMNIAVNFDAPSGLLGGGSGSDGPIGSISGVSGSAVSSRTGNPIIMRPVTMMNHPVWASAPSFDDMRRAYPARGGQKEGFAVLRCVVERDGTLARCDTSKETPDNLGFGASALSLAALFRVSPEVMARAPRAASIQVVVPISFEPPGVGAEQTVVSPAWISGFNPAAAPKLFPPEAVARGLTSGRGVARCRVEADGSLAECSPEKADPDQIGFSEAAVVLARTMKMNLWSMDAGPVRGGVVRVAIRLNLAPSP